MARPVATGPRTELSVMSRTPTPPTVGRSETADATCAQRLNEWRNRLDAFADAFNAEISQILTTLAELPVEAPRSLPAGPARDVSPVPTGAQTMEFKLPPASIPPTPLPQNSRLEAQTAAPPGAASAGASTSATGPAAASSPRVATTQNTAQRPESAAQAPPQPPAAASEPNRLAALKARLSQQMASTGQSPAAACSSEGSRS